VLSNKASFSCVLAVSLFNFECLLLSSRFIITTHSRLFLILQSFTMILDGMSQGPKVLRQ
jgi:hypothetical protein